MSCPSPNNVTPRANNWRYENWSGRVSGSVNHYFEPQSLPELVNIVERASREGHQVRVAGSAWSFEDVGYCPDWMISINNLSKPLDYVTDTALSREWADRQTSNAEESLLHVEAGIQIANLNQLLHIRGRALASLGGANGQTLAGAISTGTHGGDINLPPLADLVMAMHVVTVGGQELWVERASERVTKETRLAKALKCKDAHILYDDALFSAMLVAFGRFGIIYSYVLRVRKAFRLAEWTVEISRIELTNKLRRGIAEGTLLKPLLESLPPPPTDLHAQDSKNPVGLEVVFETQNLEKCWVKRRWVAPTGGLPQVRRDINMEYFPDTICQDDLKTGKKAAEKVKDEGVEGFHKLAAAAGAAGAGTAIVAGIFSFGIGAAISAAATAAMVALYESKAHWLEERYTQNPSMSPGEMLSLVMRAVWDVNLGVVISQKTAEVFKERYKSTMEAGKRGASYLIISGDPRSSQQTCYRADSIEPIFDAWKIGYIDFLEAILLIAPQKKQAGYISIRWSATSKALLSMHNFDSRNAVAVEVTSLKGLPENQPWMTELEALSLRFDGRPHWGQINTLTEQQVVTLYGERIKKWRTALVQVSDASTTFSSNFTQQRGLEPGNVEGKVTAISPRTDELLVVGIRSADQKSSVKVAHWAPTSNGWNKWHSLDPASGPLDNFVGSVAEGGRAFIFWIGPDGWVYFRVREQGGQWSIWWVVGGSNVTARNGVPGGAVHAISCQAGMLHVFYTNPEGVILTARADTNGVTWPENRGILQGRTIAGGHITAVSRRPGQIDAFFVGMDKKVYTASWNAHDNWQGWWAIPGLTGLPGAYVGAVSRNMDLLDVFVADEHGRTMSAAWEPNAQWQGGWHIQNGITKPGAYVTAISRSTDKLDIFMTTVDQRIHTAAWDPNAGWGGWWAINDAKAVTMVWPVNRSQDKLDLFFVNPGGTVQTAAWAPGRPWGGPWNTAE